MNHFLQTWIHIHPKQLLRLEHGHFQLFLGNYDRHTQRPTDGQTHRKGSFLLNVVTIKYYKVMAVTDNRLVSLHHFT